MLGMIGSPDRDNGEGTPGRRPADHATSAGNIEVPLRLAPGAEFDRGDATDDLALPDQSDGVRKRHETDLQKTDCGDATIAIYTTVGHTAREK
jgi:hypothetical protein